MMTQQSPAANRIFRDRDRLIRDRQEEEHRIIHPDCPLSDVLADGSWRGQACFIIGGGPSLVVFDFERLRGRGKIIVINKGFVRVPFADVAFFMDHASFYTSLRRGLLGPEAIEKWKAFAGVKAFLNLRGRKVEEPAVHSIRSLGRTGLASSIRRGLYHGNNSGYGAIQLALCLGADPIYLLGYDMKHNGRLTHWHGGYHYRQPETTLTAFRQEIDNLGAAIAAKTTDRIINLNPDSGLRAFPKKKIDEVLN